MKLHLDMPVSKSSAPVQHGQSILLMGSCFSEHIAGHLKGLKFNAYSNPFGIVFNPASISQSLQRILSGTQFTKDDLLFHNQLWHGIEAHGSLSGADQNTVLLHLNTQLAEWRQLLEKTDWLMITPGTSYAYRHLQSQRYVANCHKIPAAAFSKELLSAEQITKDLSQTLALLHELNPACQVLFTVSPVKHLRDGVVENTLSKAILIQSVHQLTRLHPHCVYFPAYELVTEDLRDYRFFDADMAHPNRQAIDYVWQKFSEAFFEPSTATLNTRLEALSRAMKHRPLNSGSNEFKIFKRNYTLKCEALQDEYPFLDLGPELDYFRQGAAE